MTLILGSPVQEIFNHLADEVYDPKKGHVNWGHDHNHVLRLLAARRAWWSDIVHAEPEVADLEFTLDLAILFHELNRSKNMLGRGEDAQKRRADYAACVMRQFGIKENLVAKVNQLIAASHEPDSPDEEPALRLLRDLDKSDIGAVGIYRMAAVASDRRYGIYARAQDFDPDTPTIDGDENLDSFAADICFCLDWFEKPKFAIRTPVIRRLVVRRFQFMREFLLHLKREHEELGLI